MIVTKDTKLHDVVISEPAIIAVLSRFDITLGIGDNTVRRICDERGINSSFFVDNFQCMFCSLSPGIYSRIPLISEKSYPFSLLSFASDTPF